MDNTKKHKSNYTDSLITSAQKITEMICITKAQKEGRDLPKFFWRLPEWKVYYKQQILAANGLLRIYSPKAIISALSDKRAKNFYSLRAPMLDALILEYERKIESTPERQEIPEIETINVEEKPRPSFSPNKTKLSKLKELE